MFFCFKQVPFHKGTLISDHTDSNYGECKRYPVQRGFRYVQVPLKTGCTVQPFMLCHMSYFQGAKNNLECTKGNLKNKSGKNF